MGTVTARSNSRRSNCGVFPARANPQIEVYLDCIEFWNCSFEFPEMLDVEGSGVEQGPSLIGVGVDEDHAGADEWHGTSRALDNRRRSGVAPATDTKV